MAKSSKKTKGTLSGVPSAAESTREPKGVASGMNADAQNVSAGAKPASKTARKKPSTMTRKTLSAPAKSRKTASAKKTTPAQTAISDEQIRVRAYFIAEKRAQQGLPADASSDWLEARQQLLAEAAGQA